MKDHTGSRDLHSLRTVRSTAVGRSITASACALLLSAVASSAAGETRNSYSASVFALEGGELLYIERHVETWREGQLAEFRGLANISDDTGERYEARIVFDYAAGGVAGGEVAVAP